MKVVQINVVSGTGSTGKIVEDLSTILNENNIENYILYSSGKTPHKNSIKYMSDLDVKLNAFNAKIFGNYGFNSIRITNRLIKKLVEIEPDIIHLHNIHGHNLNLKMFFNYLKISNVRVIWTFHDCWAFTGYCTYFDFVRCDKWKSTCKNCPSYKAYSLFNDKSNYLFNKKKELFLDFKDLTIVTPSKWLADLTKESFLKNYPVKVINNGINLDVFKPTKSNFREKYNLINKKIMLGVAMGVGERKGFKYFLELSKIIDNDFIIFLVGLNNEQISKLPSNIIGINRTNNQKELAEIYSSCDVFINPTLEDNFPTVNIEALACGTPIVTFNTGGSVEAADETTGIIVPQGDTSAMYNAVVELCKSTGISEKCVRRAKDMFDGKSRYLDYLDLYKKEILS